MRCHVCGLRLKEIKGTEKEGRGGFCFGVARANDMVELSILNGTKWLEQLVELSRLDRTKWLKQP